MQAKVWGVPKLLVMNRDSTLRTQFNYQYDLDDNGKCATCVRLSSTSSRYIQLL